MHFLLMRSSSPPDLAASCCEVIGLPLAVMSLNRSRLIAILADTVINGCYLLVVRCYLAEDGTATILQMPSLLPC